MSCPAGLIAAEFTGLKAQSHGAQYKGSSCIGGCLSLPAGRLGMCMQLSTSTFCFSEACIFYTLEVINSSGVTILACSIKSVKLDPSLTCME